MVSCDRADAAVTVYLVCSYIRRAVHIPFSPSAFKLGSANSVAAGEYVQHYEYRLSKYSISRT